MPSSSLKILREFNDYTQLYVAEDVLGISQASYARLESKPNKITAEQVMKLAALYKIDAYHLMMGSVPVLVFTNGPANNQQESEIKLLQANRDFLLQQNAALLEIIKQLSSEKSMHWVKKRLTKTYSHALEQ